MIFVFPLKVVCRLCVSVCSPLYSYCLGLNSSLLNEWRLSKGVDRTEDTEIVMHLDLDHFLFPDTLKPFPSKPHTRAFCLVSKTLFSIFSHFQPVSYPKVSMSPADTLFLPLVTSITKFPTLSLRCCVIRAWCVCDKAASK